MKQNTPTTGNVGAAEVAECFANRRHLTVEPVDESAAIASLDESFAAPNSGRETRTLPRDVLGVDDVHAGRRDREMIDVAAAAWHATVVEDDRAALRGPALERPRDRLLADRPAEERSLVSGRASDSEQQPADVRMSAADARFAVVPSA